MRARVPASSANLGPGFDALAVALQLYVEVSVEPAPRFEMTSSGHGADLHDADPEHLAARIAIEVTGHDRIRVEVDSEIPVGRGLGSSASLAIAAAAAAGAADPFAYGVRTDGHAENAAASAFGGLIVATMIDGAAVWRRLPLDPDLTFVAVVPNRHLLTKEARAALPATVDRQDAVFNLGRMGLLIAGLADAGQLIAPAGDDRLHQPPRTPLFPESAELLLALRRAGALTSFWSGAGPTLLAVCRKQDDDAVASGAQAALEASGISGEVKVLQADLGGITLSGPSGL